MAVTTAVLSGTITDLTGALTSAYLKRVVVVIESNTDGSMLLDTAGNRILAGPKRVTVDTTTGAYSVTLPKTTSADIIPVASRLYRVRLIYPSGIPGAGNIFQLSGWWELTADGSLSDEDKWAGLEVTEVTDELLASLTEMVAAAEAAQVGAEAAQAAVEAIVATTDGLMTVVDANAGSAFRVQQTARFAEKLDNASTSTSGALTIGKLTKVDATAGAKTMTLADGTIKGQQVAIEKVDTSTNTVTTTGKIRSTGAGSISLAYQYETIVLIWGGTYWEPLAGHRTKTSIDSAIATLAEPRALPSGRVGVKSFAGSTYAYNLNAATLRKWNNALAKAVRGEGYARLNLYGDSITLGYPGDGAEYWVNAPATQLRKMIDADIGATGGTGIIYPNAGDSRLVSSTYTQMTAGYGSFGTQAQVSSNTSALWTFTPDVDIDSVTIYALSGSGSLNVSIDGATAVSYAVPSSSAIIYPVVVPCGPLGPHVIKVSPAAAVAVYLFGIEGTVGATGVRVNRLGKGGSYASDLAAPTGDSGTPVGGNSLASSFDMAPPDLSIIHFGHNEFLNSVAVADYKTATQTLITRAKTTGDVILVTQIPNFNVALTPTQAAYDAALYELADSNDVALIDLSAKWGPRASNTAMYTDGTHPNPKGMADMAATYKAALPVPAKSQPATAWVPPVSGAVRHYSTLNLRGTTGDTVSTLPDFGRDGMRMMQLTRTKRPTLAFDTGVPVIVFDGTDDEMVAPISRADPLPITVISIVKVATPGASVVPWSVADRRTLFTTGSAYYMFQSSASPGSAGGATGWRFVAQTFDGASSKTIVDATKTTGNPGTGASSWYSLGALSTAGPLVAGSSFAGLTFAAQLVYFSALSDADIALIRASAKQVFPFLP